MNIYKNILETNIPRLLSLYDSDPLSPTYGYGDRLFWGWKLSDFSNATMQGGVHALAIAVKLGLVKNEKFVLEVIESAIFAVEKIRRKNGALEEAFPGEHSFCVTALVAFDLLSAIKHLEDRLTTKEKTSFLKIIEPLVRFTAHNPETHAIISNHLATAAAAVALWNSFAGNPHYDYKNFLNTIYHHQSAEGWYKEYEAADPGYQTLCTHYLFSLYQINSDEQLRQSLVRSADFLRYFLHPDGTIGGLYGARNTEVYYPGGVVGLAHASDGFAVLASHLHKGIENNRHISPQQIDAGNFIPLINSYATAALHYENNKNAIGAIRQPAPYAQKFEKSFPETGIFIKSTPRYYAIINYKKGGVLKVFDQSTQKIDTEDGGLFGVLHNGHRFSTQHFSANISFDKQEILAHFYKIHETRLTPLKNILLRLLSLTVFRCTQTAYIFKKLMIEKLITGKASVGGSVLRKFIFTDEKITIIEKASPPRNSKWVGRAPNAKAIHMASSGYYSKQREETEPSSKFVEIK